MGTDRLTIRMVVAFLGFATLAGLALVGVLAYQSKAVPDALIALTSGALAAVAALLSRTGSDEPGAELVLSDEEVDRIAEATSRRVGPAPRPPKASSQASSH